MNAHAPVTTAPLDLHAALARVHATPATASPDDVRVALSLALNDRLAALRLATDDAAGTMKRVHYLSMEFLVGRVLEDGLSNLGLLDDARAQIEALGFAPDAVFHEEPDPALGNGGLGRLAACFLESLATIGAPAMGHGILYEHGLFRQRFEDGHQVEEPEDWLRRRPVWAVEQPAARRMVGFGGHVEHGDRARWRPAEVLEAEPHDLVVPGWGGQHAAVLRLWQPRAVDPFDLGRFNGGDHVGAQSGEMAARAIGRVLYPDDNNPAGEELRLRQEYFFTAAALADLTDGIATEDLPDRVAVQLNDTHPAIAGPELVRLLHDERGLSFEEAVDVARRCLAYTNHTLLPEALERWSEGLMAHLLPRHAEIIAMIDEWHAARAPDRKVAIREHGQVGMGPLAFVMAHKVNGVSALHSDLMTRSVFAELHRLHPDRIVNQTNGVTPRRWIQGCNPRLAALLTEAVGEGWQADLERLADLPVDDAGFLERFDAVKRANKADLAAWLAGTGVRIDPAAMIDVQIKRIHEYKRQHLNLLETVALWQAMRDDPGAGWTPRVKVFGGKAAPGYHFAKGIIRLINDAARVINADPVTRDLLQVVYPPNYNVTLAERLIPAADLSEQISTAGKEASGTGNMKFALNGAVTVGTLDGANVEIREHVGAENFFLFGLKADEVDARRAVDHHAAKAIADEPRLARALDAVRSGAFGDGHGWIADNVAGPDYFLVASDFADYWRAQRAADEAFAGDGWTGMAARNVARSGWFSSDRTIRGYMADIWGIEAIG
ncbi:glycogen/starch/alpha-glucan family phosphorylase [Jannaschia sp. Os4]|uniref:glycogen/starch/alpha-glucan phosphorylase n=1 Tax=Jannaschia sp. Os4 TaxID=2807617 RepID=UPI0019393371|nr:glycogen/starch/alpha-glucan phosphorylase [Jannaschia sp. Os4]MBM2575585.1 glycogen/starch/alpha-glucan family phosphorylase [Jannaschia sp. Os4]